MSTPQSQPQRDDDDLLLEAVAEEQTGRPLPEAPEGAHPRIPESVSRRLRDRSAGVEFDPKAVRSPRPAESAASGQAPSAPAAEQASPETQQVESTTTAPASAARPASSSGRVVAPPVPEPVLDRPGGNPVETDASAGGPEPVPAGEPAVSADSAEAPDAATPAEPAAEPAEAAERTETAEPSAAETGDQAADSAVDSRERESAALPAPVDPHQERPTRRSRMAQLPAEERRDRPTALSGGLPAGQRPVRDGSTPAPWGRLAPQSGTGRDDALSLAAPAPKPVSAQDAGGEADAVAPSAVTAGERKDTEQPTSTSAPVPAAEKDTPAGGAFTTTRIVLLVVLLLLIIALILLFVL